VLLVEDDPAVRKMVARSLGVIGYQVLEAADGESAVKAMEESGGKVDAVLTDMVMPGMSGKDLVDLLRARWPTIGVVMMSGYTGESYAESELIPTEVGFLEKPFAVAELRRAIRNAVASRTRVDGPA
jgi:DNA-binding NtrC family response regulator